MPTNNEIYTGKLKTIKQWYKDKKISLADYFKLKNKLADKYLGVTIEEVINIFGQTEEDKE